MEKHIKGLHHVTSMAGNANQNNRFFTKTLGLRRVKKTVNFDAPEVYHLYYGDEVGTPGSVMTYFPFGQMPRGTRGVGEVGVTEFAVPKGTLGFWQDHLAAQGVTGLTTDSFLGETRLQFDGPDGDDFALVEAEPDGRSAWTGDGIGDAEAILGFHGARFRLQDAAATGELLQFMGYEKDETDGNVTRCGPARGPQGPARYRLSGDPRDRPRLLLGDLFPHAGWCPVRDCHERAGL